MTDIKLLEKQVNADFNELLMSNITHKQYKTRVKFILRRSKIISLFKKIKDVHI
jgi:hypothetical protein